MNISGHKNGTANDEQRVKAAAAHQLISFAIDDASHSFQLYSEEIFTGICRKDLNHGVTIVGYGEIMIRRMIQLPTNNNQSTHKQNKIGDNTPKLLH